MLKNPNSPEPALLPGWSIEFQDGVTLRNSEGETVPLAYRKVGELLVALLRAPERTSLREDLSALLWPSSGAAAQAINLRQAIKKLRLAIGHDNVVADRFECGIAEGFACSMESHGVVPTPTWLGGWMVFLEALSSSSPVQFIEAIRANTDLLCELPQPELSVLLVRAANGLSPKHGLDGWKEFALGFASFRDVPKAAGHFSLAAKRAGDDPNLFARSAYWLSACQILLGRPRFAETLANEASSRSGSNESLLAIAKATALLHMGKFAESRELMATGSSVDATTVFEHDQREALRAFYLGTTGYHDEAMRLVESIRRERRHHPGGRVAILTDLARSAVGAVESPQLVVDTMNPRIRTLVGMGEHHLALYASETLAVAQAHCNLRSEARETFFETRRTRKRLGITYSAWDAYRLAPFAAQT
jgi:hypothetical protein